MLLRYFLSRFISCVLALTDFFYKTSRCLFLMQEPDINKQLTIVTLPFYTILVHGSTHCTIAFNWCSSQCKSFRHATLSLNALRCDVPSSPDLHSGSLPTFKFHHGLLDGNSFERLSLMLPSLYFSQPWSSNGSILKMD